MIAASPDTKDETVKRGGGGAPTHVPTFSLSVLCRCLQGLSATIPLLAAFHLHENAGTGYLTASFCASAMVCGSGIGVLVDRLSQRWPGDRTGCLVTVMTAVSGAAIAWVGESPESLISAAMLIGIGIGADWSSVSELARRHLANTVRWKGMCVWTTAFPVGISLAIVTDGDLQMAFYSVLAMSAVLFLMLLFTDSPRPFPTSTGDVSAQEIPGAPAKVTAKPVATDQQIPDSNAQTDCDVTECCGGSLSEIRPTPFSLGVLLATTGIVSLWSVLCWTLHWRMAESATLIPVAAMGIVGYAMMLSVAPRVGYVVALLPALLFAFVFVLLERMFSVGTFWNGLATFAGVMFAAAVTCGVSALIGELFADCPTDAVRSRVLSFALFTAAIVLPIPAVVRWWLQSEGYAVTLIALVFALGIFLVRRIPSPVISSLGRDDPGDQDDEELKDVLAAIGQ